MGSSKMGSISLFSVICLVVILLFHLSCSVYGFTTNGISHVNTKPFFLQRSSHLYLADGVSGAHLDDFNSKNDYGNIEETVNSTASVNDGVEIKKDEVGLPISPLDSCDTQTDEQQLDAPSVRKILKFAIPAIGVWLCSPLLSMIDTSTVGLFAGTAQQAALNPATACTDYLARTMSFLYTGVTNMVAVAQDRDHQGTGNSAETERRFFGALQLSLIVGSTLCCFLIVLASHMLRLLIGNDSLDPEVFSVALKYVRIRALGMPAAAMIGTAQAACLGMQDVKSPLYLILVAAILNLIADLLLVRHPNPWIGGAAGAAWATVLSQYFAISLFIRHLMLKGKPDEIANTGETDRKPTWYRFQRFQRPRLHASSTRGLLADKLTIKMFFGLPDNETIKGFLPYVVPVTTTQIGRCSTYIAMGHVVSSSLGTISMAANQVITSIFYTLIPIADSLSLTAQSFLPGTVARKPSEGKSRAIQSTVMNLLKAAGIFGLFLATIVTCIPSGCQLFTTDASVVDLVCKIVPVLFIIFSLHGVFCGSEGVLLAHKDLSFLGRMYAVYFAVVPYLMLRIKYAAKAGQTVDLTNVWNLFLRYQLVRISVWVGRVIFLLRRHDREAAANL